MTPRVWADFAPMDTYHDGPAALRA